MQLPKRGNFFKVLDVLLDIDSNKSMDYLKAMSGNAALCKPRKRTFEQRDNFIHKRIRLLNQNKLSLMEILTQFSKMENCMIAENNINEIHTSDDEFENTNEENLEENCTKNNNNHKETLLCVICCDKERQLVFKVCQPCYQQINEASKSKGNKTLCPICRTIIKDVLLIFCFNTMVDKAIFVFFSI